ncbi:hypothetical protein ACWEWX_02750 [Streptomyces asiaticus]
MTSAIRARRASWWRSGAWARWPRATASSLSRKSCIGLCCSSSFAVEGYAESLRLQLRGCGVEVVLVEPDAFRTGIRDSSLLAAEPPESSPYAADLVRLRAFHLSYIANHLVRPGLGRTGRSAGGRRPTEPVAPAGGH